MLVVLKNMQTLYRYR